MSMQLYRPQSGMPASSLGRSARSARWPTPAILAGIVGVGAALRSYGLFERPFWFDEAFAWRLSQFALPELVRRIGEDNHPPLYPVLLKGWSALWGTSPAALRSLSVLLGAATIVGMYLFAFEACGHGMERGDRDATRRRANGTALFTAALVAISLFQVRWSWDARIYALGATLAAFSSWALFRALRLGSAGAWLTYALAALAFLYTHYYALFSVFAQALFTGGWFWYSPRFEGRPAPRRRGLWLWAAALTIVIGGFAPWAPVLVRQYRRDRAEDQRAPLTLAAAVEAPFAMFFQPEDYDDAGWEAGLFSALALVGLSATLWGGRGAEWYVFLAAVAPLLLGVAVSLAGTQVFALRYLVFSHLFWLAAAASAISRIKASLWRASAGVWLTLTMAVAMVDFGRRLDFAARPGARGAADELDRRRAAGERVVVCMQLYYLPLLYHSRNRDRIWLFDGDHVRRHVWGSGILREAELISAAALSKLAAKRVWVVDAELDYGAWRVAVPRGWVVKSEKRFDCTWRDEGRIVVVEYETRNGNPGHDR